MPELPEQLDEIREQLAIEPFNAELHQALGKALLKAGDLEAARDAYEQAIILDPADPWSHLYMSNYFYARELCEDALAKASMHTTSNLDWRSRSYAWPMHITASANSTSRASIIARLFRLTPTTKTPKRI